MTTESDTTEVQPVRAVRRTRRAATSEATLSPGMTAVVDGLPPGSNRTLAAAPGRLDVLGASADYLGSLVVNRPLARRVFVGVSPRDDGMVSIAAAGAPHTDGALRLPVSALAHTNGNPTRVLQAIGLSDGGDAADTRRTVVGTLAEMWRDGMVSGMAGGFSIVLASELQGLTDVGHTASVAAATLVALAALCRTTLDAAEATRLCQRVENQWLSWPVGPGDAACALGAESGTLARTCGETGRQVGSLSLPDNVVLLGIDSGASCPDAAVTYVRYRTAAFMGRALIERIMAHDPADAIPWEGYLSRIPEAAYVERFRDRIPTRLTGREFLDRFGETGDPLTRIDPDFVYKIRSRTEHHIYEHGRAHRFAELIDRARADRDDEALRLAGEVMYASHWSYGQRCGLASIQTDLLVNLVRRCADQDLVYGAKITGRGCGGVVAVLMRDTDAAWNAIHTTLHTYEQKTGRTTSLLQGSHAGALRVGTRRV